MVGETNGPAIWILGASQGLGRALALELASRGKHVVASARSKDKLQSLAEEGESTPGRITALSADVTDPKSLTTAREWLSIQQIDVGKAVLNAGTHDPMAAAEISAQRFAKLVDLNLMGVVNCLELVVPEMVARGHGSIAIVASVAGYFGMPTSSAYGASKAALINLAETLRAELGPKGVKVQLVSPGFVKTPLTDRNDFPMPFLMAVEDAAKRFADGLESDRFEIVFPRRLAYPMKLLRALPYPFLFAVTRRLNPRRPDKQ